ncbi:phosphatidylserine decarboxylase [Roseburia hominis]
MKYIDREGNITIEDSGQDRLLKWLYTHHAGRGIIRILIRPGVSKLAGRLLGQRWSTCLISPFIKRNHINMSCYEKKIYPSYNAFFTRKLKEGKRCLPADERVLVSPCDGKLSVYPIGSGTEKGRFCIKHTEYTVRSLLRSKYLADRFEGGYVCVFRLTVDDYHRYCYAANGRKSRNRRIQGFFHTVNPAANAVYPIYKENTREYSLLKSDHFKTILMMEVGALMVGKITNYHGACEVKRGQEKGRFEFGGSTVVLMLQKDAVQIDADLLENTRRGFETYVKMGERIGVGK